MVNYPKINPKYNIVAPVGAFGNHVRWLVLLDDSFKWNLSTYNKEKYETFKGSDWPAYADLLDNKLQNININIIEEMETLFDISPSNSLIYFDNLKNKLTSIKEKIYPSTRTWHNWQDTEWEYRNILNKLVILGHMYDQVENKVVVLERNAQSIINEHNDLKTLILTIDPKLAFRSVGKLISTNNYKNLSLGIEEFYNSSNHKFEISFINEQNQTIAKKNPNNIKLLDASILFDKTLNREWYQELIDWFGLEYQYEQANFVHGLWFDASMRIEREIVQDTQKLLQDLQKLYGL